MTSVFNNAHMLSNFISIVKTVDNEIAIFSGSSARGRHEPPGLCSLLINTFGIWLKVREAITESYVSGGGTPHDRG
jgi:hypothetical protein